MILTGLGWYSLRVRAPPFRVLLRELRKVRERDDRSVHASGAEPSCRADLEGVERRGIIGGPKPLRREVF